MSSIYEVFSTFIINFNIILETGVKLELVHGDTVVVPSGRLRRNLIIVKVKL